ncbi:uncharacterized protein LOC131622916 [Vicia villosa]|uniref:uncharacterized protein LOC131622916 n=1 Tax=Vicia villosa TaxID=3911 RepID=UPI00273AF0A2|nr:uncharacterized protein LOC131622916 [Vicia villosa]
MAKLFVNQGKEYANARPSYPPQLFQFIASKTPSHNLVWDAATGSGQAAKSLATLYKNVIATDVSEKQLEFATKLPNVQYQLTPSTMSIPEVEQIVAPQGTIDLVTIAQGLHWFNLPNFYNQVKWVLKKPHGVIAAWCYLLPIINDEVDILFGQLYYTDSKPYWDSACKLVEENYRSIDFPFEVVDGVDHTGPFEFVTETLMSFDGLLTLIRSWSGYQTAKEKGVELLREDVVEKFKVAWGEDHGPKTAKFPIYLRIGKVGNV